MTEKMRELCALVGVDLVANHSMTTDEILDCIHCGVNSEGEIISLDTGEGLGIWYDEIEY